MHKSILTIFSLLFLISGATGQLSVSNPQTQNLFWYNFMQSLPTFYDTGVYQVYTTPNGYSVVTESTGQSNVFNNTQCVGTNASQFFCVNPQNNQTLSQVTLPTGTLANFTTLNSSITNISSSWNSVIVSLSPNLNNLTVFQPPSTTAVCTMNLSSNSFVSASYYGGVIFLTPPSSSPCTGGSCNFNAYYCSNNSLITVPLNYQTNNINQFNLIPMFFSNGTNVSVIGFPLKANGNSGSFQGSGYFIMSNSTYVSSIGKYNQVLQINLTNILLVSGPQLTQYNYNFATGQFTQVGNSLTLPNLLNVYISNINQNVLALSTAYGSCNIYVNVNTMTVSGINHALSAQTFTNGSTFAFHNAGYFVYSPNNYYISTISNINGMIPLSIPASYPTNAFALVSNQSSSLFFSLDLTSSNQPTLTPIPNFSSGSVSGMLSVIPVSGNYWFATYGQQYINYTSTASGALYNFSAAYNTQGQGSNWLVFMNAQTNISMVYCPAYTVTVFMNNWTTLNSTFSSQFGGISKLNENLLLTWSVNSTNNSLLVTVINAFSQATLQTFTFQNATDVSASSYTVLAQLNSQGSVTYVTVSFVNSSGVNQLMVMYPDQSNYTTSIGNIALPGPSGTVNFCLSQLSGFFVNCTQYNLMEGSGSSAGGSGVIIAIVAVVLLLGVGGFCYRRSMIRKRNIESGGTVNIAMTQA